LSPQNTNGAAVSTLPREPAHYVEKMRALHLSMQAALLRHLAEQEESPSGDELSGVADVRGGDTIYRIDAHIEEILFDGCEAWAREDGPFV
jgi:hypothetical protein